MIAQAILTLALMGQVKQGLQLKDEGTSKGDISTINCVGASIACTRSGATGTLTLSGSITDTVALTGTTTTNTITSDTTAATATSAIAAITMNPTAALGANDLVLEVNNSAGTQLFAVDAEGDLKTGGLTPLANSTYSIGSSTGPLIYSEGYFASLRNSAGGLAIGFGGSGSGPTLYDGTVVRVSLTNGAGSFIRGNDGNDSAATGVHFSNTITLNTAGGRIAKFYNDDISTVKAAVDINGFFLQPVQTVTVADDAGGSAPASSVTPSSNIIKLAYNDATGSSVGTISETGAQEGSVIYITHTGSGASVDFTESSGVLEGSCTLNVTDVLTALYINSAWYVTSCKDN